MEASQTQALPVRPCNWPSRTSTPSLSPNPNSTSLTIDGFGDTREVNNDVGEKAAYIYIYMEIADMTIENSDLAFIRCKALVHVRMGDTEQRQIVSYAQRLDERLAKVICK